MAVTKKPISVTLDCDVYEAAKNKYNNISARVNELLAMDLYGSDEKDKLVKQLHDLKIKEKTITKRLCQIEQEEVLANKAESNKELVLEWVKMIYHRNGVIGLNKLEDECKRHNVDFDEMVNYLEGEDIAMVKYA